MATRKHANGTFQPYVYEQIDDKARYEISRTDLDFELGTDWLEHLLGLL